MKKYWPVLLLVVVLCVSACSTFRVVEPLERGEHAAGVSVGGPLFDDLGFPMPVPNISLNYQYGLTRNFSIGGAVYVTPIIFNLFGMVELDAAFTILRQNRFIPNLTLNSVFYFVSDFEDFRVYPNIGLIPSWRITPWFLFYTGASVFLDFFPPTEGITERHIILPVFPIGFQFDIGRVTIVAELQYQMPFGTSQYRAIHFIGISDWGALAPYIGVSLSFGGEK